MIVNSKSKVVVIPNSVNLPMYEKYAPDIDYQIMWCILVLISPVFLLDESQKELAEFPNSIVLLLVHSYEKFNNTAILVLHLISTAIQQ